MATRTNMSRDTGSFVRPDDQTLEADFDEAMKGDKEVDAEKNLLREFELKLQQTPAVVDVDRQISELDTAIKDRQSLNQDFSVLNEEKQTLKKIRALLINIALLKHTQETKPKISDPKLIALYERKLSEHKDKLYKLREPEIRRKAKETTAEIRSTPEMNELISDLKHYETEIAFLEKNEPEKTELINLLKKKRGLLFEKYKHLNSFLRYNLRISKGENDDTERLRDITLDRMTRMINTANENLAVVDGEIENYHSPQQVEPDQEEKSAAGERKVEKPGKLEINSAENVKRIIYSLLKNFNSDPFLYRLIGDDATLIEDLLAKAKLKDDKLILDTKILARFVSDRLMEATNELAVAGIKLDKYGEPKVGILSRIFTNKAIDQKGSPAYKKYRMLRDLNNTLTDRMPSDYASLLGEDYIKEAKGYRVTEKPSAINEAISEAASTQPAKRVGIDSTREKFAGGAEVVGAAAAIGSLLGAVGPGLAEKNTPEQHQDIQKPAYVAKASSAQAEPTKKYGVFLTEQENLLEHGAEAEERINRRSGEVSTYEPEPEETEEARPPETTPAPRTEKAKSPKKPRPVTDEPRPMTSADLARLTKSEIPRMLTTGASVTTPEREEKKIDLPKIEPKEDDMGKIVKLFPQELVDASGNKARFRDYVAMILRYAPDASAELTDLSNKFRVARSIKSKEQIKTLFSSLKRIADKHSVPSWDKAEFINNYLTKN